MTTADEVHITPGMQAYIDKNNVYLAEREDGRIRQQVAVKVLKRGMDTDEVLRRFELERQVLAALNHPGIARLYDAGETADGMPYFVMEPGMTATPLQYLGRDFAQRKARVYMPRTSQRLREEYDVMILSDAMREMFTSQMINWMSDGVLKGGMKRNLMVVLLSKHALDLQTAGQKDSKVPPPKIPLPGLALDHSTTPRSRPSGTRGSCSASPSPLLRRFIGKNLLTSVCPVSLCEINRSCKSCRSYYPKVL